MCFSAARRQSYWGGVPLRAFRKPVVVFAGILSLAMFAGSPAAADPDASGTTRKTMSPEANLASATPAEVAEMKNQAAIDEVANRIKAAEKRQAASAPTGLSGVVVDAQANTLHLYWHGELSATAEREVTAARGTGMTVVIHPAPFTLAELKAERDRIADLYMSDKAASTYGFEVVSVGPKPDGSGLEVGVSTPASVQGPQALPKLTSSVAVQVVSMAKPQPATRFIDSQPYWGGSYMENWGTNNGVPTQYRGSCTMGFAVTAANRAGMLTANHCGQGLWWLATNPLTQYGNSLAAHIDFAHDAMVVGVPSSQGAIYDGASIAGGDTNTGKPIAGAAATNVGNTMCTSGSYSATQCGIQAVAVDQTINMGGYGQVTDMVRAERSNGLTVVGNGDSGGPVFSNTADNVRGIARGTISAIPGCTIPAGQTNCSPDLWNECHGVPEVPDNQPGRHCSWRFWYPDITVQLAGVNATIRTA